MTNTIRRERKHLERDDVWNRQRPFFAERTLNGWGFSKKSWVKQKTMKKQFQRWMRNKLDSI